VLVLVVHSGHLKLVVGDARKQPASASGRRRAAPWRATFRTLRAVALADAREAPAERSIGGRGRVLVDADARGQSSSTIRVAARRAAPGSGT
jgi:hypothetical protein